jgi:serine/threonine protein phosphatase PrpC
VKRCPKCGATAADDDLFCEADGARLEGAAPPTSATSVRAPVGDACPGCGASSSDDGDGFCNACGRRLRAGASTASVPVGATLAGGEIVGSLAADTLLARAKDGARFLVVLGDPTALARERGALEAIAAAGVPGVSRVRASGEDAKRGPFLALDPQGESTPLAQAMRGASLANALAVIEAALDRVAAVEDAGYLIAPAAEDLALDAAGDFVLQRARSAWPNLGVASAAPPSVIALASALGASLLPEVLASAAPSLARALCATPPKGAVPPTLDEIRAALAESRRPSTTPGAHADLATLTHPGCKRGYNEDAVASARGELAGERECESWTVLVVCDGVSCSTHAEMASTIGAQTACDALAHFARSGDLSHEATTIAVSEAIRAAHVAICAQRTSERATSPSSAAVEPNPPGTTIVAALLHRRRLTVGWVGDSRAYWLTARGGELLTRDHSWVNETVARGEMTEAEALASPYAHALTKCLGPLEVGDSLEQIVPDVRARDLAGPGVVLLCSDGLWNYFPDADALRTIVEGAGPDAPATLVARRLVNHALAHGGHDNVSVAIVRHR